MVVYGKSNIFESEWIIWYFNNMVSNTSVVRTLKKALQDLKVQETARSKSGNASCPASGEDTGKINHLVKASGEFGAGFIGKQMRTNLLSLLTVLMMLTGCSNSIQEAPEPEKEPEPEKIYLLQRKLSQVTFPGGEGATIDITYSYNNQNQLDTISGVSVSGTEVKALETTLNYDSQGRVKEVRNTLGTTWINTYNDKNQVVKLERKYKDAEPYLYLHTYNQNNQLTEVKTYRKEVNAEAFIGSTAYSYADTNKINIKRTTASGEIDREYAIVTDDKKRELPVLPHQIAPEFYAAEVFAERIFTRHNIVSNEVVDKATNRRNGVSYQTVYTYNEGGYPATCVKSFEQGSVENITYTYIIK